VHKILVLMNGWRDNRVGSGGDYHILSVLKDWSKQHEISVIMPRLGYASTRAVLRNGHSIYLSSREEEAGGLTRLVILYLVRILRSSLLKVKAESDIIISTTHMIYDVLPAVILRVKLKTKLVVYVHHIMLSFRTYDLGIWSNLSLLNEKIALFLCRKAADLIFVVNIDTKDALIARGFDSDKIFVTSNGGEYEFISSVRASLRKFEACFCGRLLKRKGINDLVEVWESVLKYFPESKLVIIGDGPEQCKLIDLVKNKELDRSIIITGYLPEKEKISVIKSCKLFISASYEEGWCIAVSEAIICGLPVVCYNLPAYKIFGEGIIKIELGNREAMARAVIDLLAHDDKRVASAANARQTSKISDWENIATRELKEIDNLLNH
jgi:glycosyltransferase involved in cell wall biosynthesis